MPEGLLRIKAQFTHKGQCMKLKIKCGVANNNNLFNLNLHK